MEEIMKISMKRNFIITKIILVRIQLNYIINYEGEIMKE